MQKAAEAAFFVTLCDAYASYHALPPVALQQRRQRYITAAIALTTASILRLFSAATQMRPVPTA